MNSTVIKRSGAMALAVAVALVTVTAGPADAAAKHRRHKAKRTPAAKVVKRTVAKKPTARPVVASTPAPTSTPSPVATPTPAPDRGFTSVISIGGYVFYNLTYLEAVEAYFAAVAAAPPGYTPPPVTSISVGTTIGGTVH